MSLGERIEQLIYRGYMIQFYNLEGCIHISLRKGDYAANRVISHLDEKCLVASDARMIFVLNDLEKQHERAMMEE